MENADLERYYEVYTYAMKNGFDVPPMELWDSAPSEELVSLYVQHKV